MYGIPDPHALLRPYKDLKEFSETLFSLVRPVSMPQQAQPLVSRRDQYQSNVGDAPQSPDLISPDYSATIDDDFRPVRFGQGDRTLSPRRRPRGDDRPRPQFSPPPDEARRAYTPPAEQSPRSVQASFPEQRPASPVDLSGVHSEIAGIQQQAKLASTQYLPAFSGSFLSASNHYSTPAVHPGQLPDSVGAFYASPVHSVNAATPAHVVNSGAFYGSAGSYAPPPIYPGDFYATPLYSAGTLCAPPPIYPGVVCSANGIFDSQGRFFSASAPVSLGLPLPTYVPGSNWSPIAPSSAPWASSAPFGGGYSPVPDGVFSSVPLAGHPHPFWVYPEKPKGVAPLPPIEPSAGGGAGATVGQVVSGTGDTYQVTLYSNGPDNTPDDGGPVEVKVLMIDPNDTIPVDTWLFGILQLEDGDGDPLYYAQPPVWLP